MTLKKIDNNLYKIWKKIPKLDSLNPINLESEKEKFFSSENYNPQFRYKKLRFNPKKCKSELLDLKRKLKNIEEPLIELYLKKIESMIIWINMVEIIGTKKFTDYSLKYYPKPTKQLIKKCFLKFKKPSRYHGKKTVTSEELAEYLKKKIKDKGISWKVKYSKNMVTSVCNSNEDQTLYIKKGIMFYPKDPKRIFVHEIETHAVRELNGMKSPLKLFRIGTANYEETEEGLAVLMTKRKKVLQSWMPKFFSALTVAIQLSFEKSFRNTYLEINKYYNPRVAFNICTRVKRRLKDTSKKGAFTKDFIYTTGYEKLKNLQNLNPLFYGKISLNDLELLKEVHLFPVE